MSSNRFSWWPLGGLGQVGMNCMVFKFGDFAVPVDCGILFADPNDFGIEAVHPDFEPLLRNEKPKVWLITHGHEDHIGAISSVLELCQKKNFAIPKFLAPPFAAALIRLKLSEYTHLKFDLNEVIQSIEFNEPIELESGLIVTFVKIRHSIPDAASLYFEWKSGPGPLTAFHTADFKLDFNRFKDGIINLDNLKGYSNVDFLFCDSTNSEREGHSISETKVIAPLKKLIKSAPGRVYLTLFSSNALRVAAIVKAASECGRKVVLAGRSMKSIFGICEEIGIFRDQAEEYDRNTLVSADQLRNLAPEKQLIICSGSQGEYRSVLMRMSIGEHPEFQVQQGDTVIFSSKLIPGNERPVGRLINNLLRLGANVISGEKAKILAEGPIHASGHARRDEIAAITKTLLPKHAIPVHGELRQLITCGELMKESLQNEGKHTELHLTENNHQLEFEYASDWRLKQRLELSEYKKVLRFEHFLSDSKDPFIKERKRMARGGVVSIAFDAYGKLNFLVKGVFPASSAYLEELCRSEVEQWVYTNLRQWKKERLFNQPKSEDIDFLSEQAGRLLKKHLGFKPLVIVSIIPD